MVRIGAAGDMASTGASIVNARSREIRIP
jgi:hypothetical protein